MEHCDGLVGRSWNAASLLMFSCVHNQLELREPVLKKKHFIVAESGLVYWIFIYFWSSLIFFWLQIFLDYFFFNFPGQKLLKSLL